MSTERQPKRKADPIRHIVRRTRAAMALESFLRAFWPLGSLLAAFWAVLAFGLAEFGSRGLVPGMALAAVLLALWLLVSGLRRFRWPSQAAAVLRIDANLPGRPFSALDDQPAIGGDDPQGGAVWAAHMARMRRLAEAARSVRPAPLLARADPWALRLMALVMVIAAGLFARSSGIEGIASALSPGGPVAVASGPGYEGWAEPPAYTGQPVIYLSEVAADRPLAVPRGTQVTLRAYGPAEQFALDESVSGDSPAMLAEAAPGIAAAIFEVARDGSVSLRDGRSDLAHWAFVIVPDSPPEIDLARPLDRAVTGEMELAYTAVDDYGVTAARAEFTLDIDRADRRYGLQAAPEPRPPLIVDLPLPLSGGAGDVEELLVEDLSKHPWSGLPVAFTLYAEDAIAQTGRREGLTAVLPGRRFYHPLAAALVEQRRDLLWSAGNGRRVTQVLRALTHKPEEVFENNAGPYLTVRTAIRRLALSVRSDNVAGVRDEVAEALWQAALALEEGSLGDAAERLARAKERLAEALSGNATDEEIARLMEELRQATRDYMEQLAREAIERGESQSAEAPPPGQTMTQDQIQALMDRIQELSEQGRRAEAEAMLEMLQQMLENMEMMLGQSGQGQGQSGPGQQSMQGLADALREQQGLADESFQQLQREFREGMPGQDGPGQSEGGQGESGTGPGQGLASRQEALRDLLDGLREGLPGGGGESTQQALRDAERSMGDARDSLQGGKTADALDSQSEAIDGLRDGIRELAEDMREAQQGQGGQQGQQDGQSNAENGNDPLGRPVGSRGGLGSNKSMLPEGDAAARARSILDEIRRRSSERSRPAVELDYLKRLLDRF